MKKKFLIIPISIILIFSFSIVSFASTTTLNYLATDYVTFSVEDGVSASGYDFSLDAAGNLEMFNGTLNPVNADMRIDFFAVQNQTLFLIPQGNCHFQFTVKIQYRFNNGIASTTNANIRSCVYYMYDRNYNPIAIIPSNILYNQTTGYTEFTFDQWIRSESPVNVVQAGVWFPTTYSSTGATSWLVNLSVINLDYFPLTDTESSNKVDTNNIIGGAWQSDYYKDLVEQSAKKAEFDIYDQALLDITKDLFNQVKDFGEDTTAHEFVTNHYLTIFALSKVFGDLFSEFPIFRSIISLSIIMGGFLTLTGLTGSIVASISRRSKYDGDNKSSKGDKNK